MNFPRIVALVVFAAGCATNTPEKDLATMYFGGAGPISMVAIKHGEDGRQLFIVHSAKDDRGNPRNQGHFVELERGDEKLILKTLENMEKTKPAAAAGATNHPKLTLEVRLLGKQPGAFRVDTVWGADANVSNLIATINAYIPKEFRLRPQKPQ